MLCMVQIRFHPQEPGPAQRFFLTEEGDPQSWSQSSTAEGPSHFPLVSLPETAEHHGVTRCNQFDPIVEFSDSPLDIWCNGEKPRLSSEGNAPDVSHSEKS